MHNRFKFVKTVGPLAEDVQQQVYLTRRLFFERHAGYPAQPNPDYQSQITNKKAPTSKAFGVGVLKIRLSLLSVEDAEAAPWNHWKHFATAEAEV
jgi:hypothetical protein